MPKELRAMLACGKHKILELVIYFKIDIDLEENEINRPEMKGDAAGKVLHCLLLSP